MKRRKWAEIIFLSHDGAMEYIHHNKQKFTIKPLSGHTEKDKDEARRSIRETWGEHVEING